MERIELGTQGLQTSALGFGCMGMSIFYGPADDARSARTLTRALDRGLAHFDTADFYGAGHNERLLGAALAGRRDGVVVATKFGLRFGPDGSLGPPDGRPAYVASACEASLKRLGVGTIDLYYQARSDPAVPIEETVGAMARLVEQGKVRFLGLSEVGPETLRRAHAEHPISVLQSEYSLFAREPERAVLPGCRELGIGFVASCPLGRGILGGAIRGRGDLGRDADIRPDMPWYRPGNLEANLVLVSRLRQIAGRRGASPAQIAIAWLRGQGVVPIPGTRRPGRVDENAAAARIALSVDERAAIARAVPREAIAGGRRAEASPGGDAG